jgi:serine/threonine protein kinase HipA of HipAB toxin-antitoxin module
MLTTDEIKAIRENPAIYRAAVQANLEFSTRALARAVAKTPKKNRFQTLSEALESEGVAHMWDMRPIPYGETVSLTYDDGTRYGHYVSVYRDETGLYERPVHYRRG